MLRRYLIDNGVRVTFGEIAKPDKEYKTHMCPLEAGLEHEKYVTSLIAAIYRAAFDEKDFKTMQFLDWFVKEQGEEEKNADDLIKKMKLFGGDSKGLYMLNQELNARIYTAPANAADWREFLQKRNDVPFRFFVLRRKAKNRFFRQIFCLFFRLLFKYGT